MPERDSDPLEELLRTAENLTLTDFTDWLKSLESLSDSEQASRLIDFLESGNDAATGLRFDLGSGGRLLAAPTLRVYALGLLGELDPDAAARYAIRIFDQSHSPDEWALALRNYGRRLENGSDPLVFDERIRDLLTREEWYASPTDGYLEAFDAAVFSGRGEWAIHFEQLFERQLSPRLSKASFMAFESLAAHRPLEVAAALGSTLPPSDSISPLRVAAFARLDPREHLHVDLLEQFIGALKPGSESSAIFFNLFPHANSFAGHYLLTTSPNRSLYEQAAIDQNALHLVTRWTEEGRFPAFQKELIELQKELEQFTEAARRSGFLLKASSEP